MMLRERNEEGQYREYEIPSDEPVFTSGVVSRLLGIPVWVLKRLDREEVVKPQRKRGCCRLYSKEELGKLEHVWYYIREKRVKITGIKVVLEIERRAYKREKGE